VVATDSREVAEVARAFGARVELTSPDHPSGTDRVAEVAELPAYAAYDTIVNVQGDEPFIRAETLRAATALVAEAGWAVGTAAAPITAVREWLDPAVVKVALADDGGALLFSRAPIPFVRDGEPTAEQLASGEFLRHVGLYAYGRDALRRWVALPEGRIERLERLEQLRPLAAGIRIGVARVEGVELGVDTPAEAAAAEARLRDINPSDVLS
jgi:3-deoxy-manno-octulosonate cytidylyltransferase (CMP-KDO synthetase)